MFSGRHTCRFLLLVPRILLVASLGLLLAVSAGSTGSASTGTVAAAERATAFVSGERKATVKIPTKSARRPKQAKSAKVRRVAKFVPSAKPPRRRKAPRPAVKAEKPAKRTTQPAAPAVREPVQPNDPLWNDSWSLGKVNATAAWALTTGRPETIVAVLDTGADLGHPDLQGAFVSGYDAVNHDDDPTDDHGHGTMVAGVIAARSNNAVGVTSACWGCSLMPVKVIGADGSGDAAAVAEGIVWAADHGAHVINLSFTMSGADGAVGSAIEYARSRGIVVVAAAGNNGTADPTYPAAYPGVVSVAGTDTADARYDWSSFGGWVSVAAPGCSMTTAVGGTYGEFCGTSSAAAFVSGFAGLVRSLSAELGPEAIVQALSTGAVPTEGVVATGRLNGGAVLGAFGSTVPGAAGAPDAAGNSAFGLELS